MGLRQEVKKLQEIDLELRKQKRLRSIRRILKLLLVGFFVFEDIEKTITELISEKRRILTGINELLCEELETVSNQVRKIKNSGTYLIYVDKEQRLAAIRSLEDNLKYLNENRVLDPETIFEKKGELERFRQFVLGYNKEYVEQQKKKYAQLFYIGLNPLDEEQKDAIVTDDKYNLVVAGAGSGKTEVLIKRIIYLIKRKPDVINSNRILAIAYQNKDVNQIKRRLLGHGSLAQDVNVRTFHGLGIDILKGAGKMKGLSVLNRGEIERVSLVRRIYEEKLEVEPSYFKTFLRYVKTLRDTEQEVDYKRKADTLAYREILPYTTINNEAVKSRAEKEIYDFFLTNKLNGEPVKIEYEPVITGFPDQRERRPDFRLSKYDLYIEHWALDQKDEVPWWFNQTTEEYTKNKQKKKKWFEKNNKLLVETYSREYDEENPDKFIELLRKRVIEKLQLRHGGKFEFTPMTYDEVVEVAWGPCGDPVAEDIFHFIKNAKTYGYTPKGIEERLDSENWSRKQLAFGNLAVKVYYTYEEEKRRQNKIDFEDMINEAIQELRNDKDLFADIYDHILIDEFQDITAQQVELIKVLLEHNPKCKLFCVGDDWQSVMGFAGSNVRFLVDFEKYFTSPAVTKITTNYRSIKTIVDAAADLIKNNGSYQRSKVTSSKRREEKPIMVFMLMHQKGFERQYHRQIAEECVRHIVKFIRQKGYARKDVLILIRYMRVFPQIIQDLKEKAKEKGITISTSAHAQNKVRLLTVHKSKGLEARAVFILNVIKDDYGFPCEIEDPSIYAPSRKEYPPHQHIEEERRLFYVAMTRAKEDLLVYTWERTKSEFLEEIRDHTIEESLRY